jgi:purine-binding chemotaxis protein CheW
MGFQLTSQSLVCRVRTRLCALPLERVIETLRPLPIEPLSGAPPFVCGVSIIRGEPLPVVDAGLVLGAGRARATRLVTLKLDGARGAALAVDAVIGVRAFERSALSELPPLLREAAAETVVALGSLDRELLLLLESGRLVPEAVFASIDQRRGQA